jgi:hypothetical protein
MFLDRCVAGGHRGNGKGSLESWGLVLGAWGFGRDEGAETARTVFRQLKQYGQLPGVMYVSFTLD